MSRRVGRIEWSVAARPASGHAVSGDFATVREVHDGVLVVAVDVLGHGTDAADAAQELRDAIEREPVTDLPALFARCDQLLRSERGAVMTAAVVHDHGGIHYLGVGNVQAVVVRGANRAARDWFLIRGGVVGNGIGVLDARPLAFGPGDVVVLATDGVHPAYASTIDPLESTDAIAQRVLDAHARPIDDSLVLAARYGAEARP